MERQTVVTAADLVIQSFETCILKAKAAATTQKLQSVCHHYTGMGATGDVCCCGRARARLLVHC